MADKKAKATVEGPPPTPGELAEAAQEIELGTFVVKAVNDKGAEVRMSDEGSGTFFVSRKKSANREMVSGGTYKLMAVLAEPSPEDATVLVRVRAEDVGSIPPFARADKEDE